MILALVALEIEIEMAEAEIMTVVVVVVVKAVVPVIAGFSYTSAQYNYQNSFRNLVCNVKRSNCLAIRFEDSIFAWK